MRLGEKVSGKIVAVKVRDIRFPTSLEKHGSDDTGSQITIHGDPDYSAVEAILETDKGDFGYGMTFTLGRGNEIIAKAVESLNPLVIGWDIREVFSNFGVYWKKIVCEEQIRWVGPEKGVIHMAAAALINALWDLWARLEEKPVWKLVSDMTPDEIISLLDFGWLTDELTVEEAKEILEKRVDTKVDREKELFESGYPAYQTAGWINYEDEYLRHRLRTAQDQGWTRFKAKVGSMKPEDDYRRIKTVREEIGKDGILMIDANQRWDVQEAIDRVTALAEFRPLWIEEPTKDDDVLGHAKNQKGKNVKPSSTAAHGCESSSLRSADNLITIDSCRVAGLNEIILILLMAAKFNLPVCPHAGGVGLCQMVAHIIMLDYIAISGEKEDRYCEYSAHLHEHFVDDLIMKGQNYMPPAAAGYGTKFHESSVDEFLFPDGKFWAKK
ncbi:unnamed protein product [Oikopleura dioica]|uniref:Mandelate racemase/muconate lactonizing enzyme C-terminal domain-containing protein n=1 Tax=Oikopleura dioica TaxID=34765 RepID=E4Y9J0_OIKDI|nr:unnamed protein product [Oikopleura dioica]